MEELYQESFFLKPRSAQAVEIIEDKIEQKPISLLNNTNAEAQIAFFFKRLEEDLLKQHGHCYHIPQTLHNIQMSINAGDQEKTLKLLDLLEEFLDVEYSKNQTQKDYYLP